jgi:hypothetical protein
MKKTVLILVIMALLLAGCSSLTGNNSQSVSDAQMATRVAQLLSTMTTPTQEIDFPPTPTPLSTTEVITSTPETATETATSVVVADEKSLFAVGGEADTTDTPTADTTTTATPTGTLSATSETGTSTVTATPVLADPAVSLGTPTGEDDMNDPSNWSWLTGADQYINVAFSDGFMRMTGLTSYAGWRLPMINQQVNSYIEVTANSGACTGKDSYGIIFRVPVFKDPSQGYLYEVTCDGYYRLWRWDANVGQAVTLVPWAQSSAIKTGTNQTNRLGVKTIGNIFTLYMNGAQLASASDSAFNAGFFGVFVRSAETPNYIINYDTIRYWENP